MKCRKFRKHMNYGSLGSSPRVTREELLRDYADEGNVRVIDLGDEWLVIADGEPDRRGWNDVDDITFSVKSRKCKQKVAETDASFTVKRAKMKVETK